MIKKIISVCICIAIITLVFGEGLKKYERAECLAWQAECERFKNVNWYPTSWQTEQCLNYNIELK